jgi:sigma-54 specific flagellar transcriptional regulator A
MSESRILVVESDDARAERLVALLDFLDFTPKRVGAVDELDLARARPRDWLAIVVGGVEDLGDFRRFGAWLSRFPLHPPLLVLPALHGLAGELGVHPEQVWPLDWPLRHPQLEGHLRRASLQAIRGDGSGSAQAGPEGASEAVRRLRRMIEQVAPFDTTVLILGESGTGKEVAARALHAASARSKGPFVAPTAARCRASSWRASCSATRRGPSPARSLPARAASRWPRAAPCCSTRSATCRCRCR